MLEAACGCALSVHCDRLYTTEATNSGHRWQAHLQLLVMIWRQCCAKCATPRKAWAAWEWPRLRAQPPAAPQQMLHGTLPALIVHIMRVLSNSMTGLFRNVESQVTRCFTHTMLFSSVADTTGFCDDVVLLTVRLACQLCYHWALLKLEQEQGLPAGFQGMLLVTGYAQYCRIGPGEMELGLGIHGEPGASKGPLKPVDEIVDLVRDPPP